MLSKQKKNTQRGALHANHKVKWQVLRHNPSLVHCREDEEAVPIGGQCGTQNPALFMEFFFKGKKL